MAISATAKPPSADTTVVVELSDDEAADLPQAKPKVSISGGLRQADSAAAGGEEEPPPAADAAAAPVEVESIDAALWQSVRTCARCRMPLPPRRVRSRAEGGNSPRGPSAPTAATRETNSSECSERPEEGALTAGVRRRFRAFVKRVEMESQQRERRRLDSLLEDLSTPLPSTPDPGGAPASSNSTAADTRSLSNSYSNSCSSSMRSEEEEAAFNRCLQVLGGIAAPAAAAAPCSNRGSGAAWETPETAAAEMTPSAVKQRVYSFEAKGPLGPSASDSSSIEAVKAEESSAAPPGCGCSCRQCECCLGRVQFCRAEYLGMGGSTDSQGALSRAEGSLRASESEEEAVRRKLSHDEWDFIRKTLHLLRRTGIIGLVAIDQSTASANSRLRLLPLPRGSAEAPPEKGSGGPPPVPAGEVAAVGLHEEAEAGSTEDEDDVTQLRRALEQPTGAPFWRVFNPSGAGGPTTAAAAARDTEGGPELFDDDIEKEEVLCKSCISDGWVSAAALPKLLDRFRSACTNSTCSALACNKVTGRCESCRASAAAVAAAARRRRWTSFKQPQIFRWSRNSCYDGLAASAQACNMRQDEAEMAYDEYAALQLEEFRRNGRLTG